jgi:membrane protease YdiL (CAAX protease family)
MKTKKKPHREGKKERKEAMVSRNNNTQKQKRDFRLYEHPWLSLLVAIAAYAFSEILVGIVAYILVRSLSTTPTEQFIRSTSSRILTVFIIAPFILRLPKGKRAFRQYLDDIGLSRVQPFFRLLLLAFSCYAILALSQVAASFTYRLFEGLPITWSFFRWQIFDLSGDLPPNSLSLLISFPSIFEEMLFRGIVLTVFLRKYSERQSVVFSSVGFGLWHLLGLLVGGEPVWFMGMVVWAFVLGLFYGYVFVRTRSLLPPMIVHYLGNLFISSLVGYIQTRASIETQVLYGIVISQGIIPTALMILWARFFSSKWLPGGGDRSQQYAEEAI